MTGHHFGRQSPTFIEQLGNCGNAFGGLKPKTRSTSGSLRISCVHNVYNVATHIWLTILRLEMPTGLITIGSREGKCPAVKFIIVRNRPKDGFFFGDVEKVLPGRTSFALQMQLFDALCFHLFGHLSSL